MNKVASQKGNRKAGKVTWRKIRVCNGQNCKGYFIPENMQLVRSKWQQLGWTTEIYPCNQCKDIVLVIRPN